MWKKCVKKRHGFVTEYKQIYFKTKTTFYHILRDLNSSSNQPATEYISHISLHPLQIRKVLNNTVSHFL